MTDWLDRLVVLVSFVYPLSALPQIIGIWVHGRTEGVSFISWGMFAIFTIPLLIHTARNNDKKLSIMYGIWMVNYALILSGILLFG